MTLPSLYTTPGEISCALTRYPSVPCSGKSFSIGPLRILNIDVVSPRGEHVIGHGLEAGRAVDLERHLSADNPGRQDQIWVPDGVIGVQVCDERVSDIDWVERRDAFLLRGRGTPHNTGAEIYQIRLAVDDHGSRRT